MQNDKEHHTKAGVGLYEKVLAYNEETGEMGYYPVVAIWAYENPVIVTLTIEGETIETTPEHPFYTVEGEWLPAASLQAGDEIRTSDWGTGTMEAIQFSHQPQLMYNFTVATAHTYFVGEGQWLVHNVCKLPSVIEEFIANRFGYQELRDLAAFTGIDYMKAVPENVTIDNAIKHLIAYVEGHDMSTQFYNGMISTLEQRKFFEDIEIFKNIFWFGE